MKLVCKLDQMIENKTEANDILTFIYKPTKEAYAKGVSLKVTGANSLQMLENLGLPYALGDTIEVDFSPKQTQSKLVKK